MKNILRNTFEFLDSKLENDRSIIFIIIVSKLDSIELFIIIIELFVNIAKVFALLSLDIIFFTKFIELSELFRFLKNLFVFNSSLKSIDF